MSQPRAVEFRRLLINVGQATFAKVTVKKTPPASGSTTPQLQIVKPTPERPQVQPVVKKGSELNTNLDYNFCPFRYYGRIQPFSKALCQGWHLPWTVDRSTRTLASSYNTIGSILTTTLNLPPGGIAVLRNRERDLILAGFQTITPELAQLLYRQSAEFAGTQAVEAQGVDITLLCDLVSTIAGGTVCDLVAGGIIDWINGLNETERQRLLGLLQELQAASDFQAQLANAVIGHSQFEQFLQRIREVWIDAGILGPNRPQSVKDDPEFIDLLRQIFSHYTSLGIDVAVTVSQLGSAALSVPLLLDSYLGRVTQDPRYPAIGGGRFVQLLADLMVKLIPGSLAMSDSQSLITLLAGLVGKALEGQPEADVRELITRVLGTFELASDLMQRGWVIKRLGVPSTETGGQQFPNQGVAVDLVAKKQIAGLDYCGTCQVAAFTVLEPYLESPTENPLDLQTLIARVAQAILFAAAPYATQYAMGTEDAWRVVIVSIGTVATGADPAQVCRDSSVQTLSSGVVPVIVAQGGQVVCHTPNISDNDAQRICQEQGLCPSGVEGGGSDGYFTDYVISAPGPKVNPRGVRLLGLEVR